MAPGFCKRQESARSSSRGASEELTPLISNQASLKLGFKWRSFLSRRCQAWLRRERPKGPLNSGVSLYAVQVPRWYA